MSAKCHKRTLADHDVQFSSRAGGDTTMASDRMPHLATGSRSDLAPSTRSALRCAPVSPGAGGQRPDSNLGTGPASWGRPEAAF